MVVKPFFIVSSEEKNRTFTPLLRLVAYETTEASPPAFIFAFSSGRGNRTQHTFRLVAYETTEASPPAFIPAILYGKRDSNSHDLLNSVILFINIHLFLIINLKYKFDVHLLKGLLMRVTCYSIFVKF